MSDGKLGLQVFICGRPFLSVSAGLLLISPAANINYFADGSNWPSKRTLSVFSPAQALQSLQLLRPQKVLHAFRPDRKPFGLPSSEFPLLVRPSFPRLQLLAEPCVLPGPKSAFWTAPPPCLRPWPSWTLSRIYLPAFTAWSLCMSCSFPPLFPGPYLVTNLPWPCFLIEKSPIALHSWNEFPVRGQPDALLFSLGYLSPGLILGMRL